ncbi:MAG: cytidylate kinase-like family protein [Chloroflexi bacterium]|nr:cytidylate kinase-like family protein [Chloroflexota bacterium]
MAIVTLSGQIGANAREIGRLVAGRLAIDYVDQEILIEAARELGVPMESIVSHDERTETLSERLAHMVTNFLERSAAAGAADPMLGGAGGLDMVLSQTYAEAAAGMDDVSDDEYVQTMANLIQDVAEHDNVVLIGRGSQVVLREHPNATHVLIVAPEELRVANVAQRDGISSDAAEKIMHSQEKGRVSFHEKFFKIAVNDPSHYHLTLNVGRLTQDQIVSLIADTAQIPAPDDA